MQTEEGIIAGRLQEDDDDADFLLLESLQCSTDDDEGSCSGEKTLGKGWQGALFLSHSTTLPMVADTRWGDGNRNMCYD